MRRWMIGAVLALGIVAPAKAAVITTGTYEVAIAPANGYMFFQFGGELTNVDYSRTTTAGVPQGGDPMPFVYSYYISATVNGIGFYDRANLNCPAFMYAECAHNPPHPQFAGIAVNAGDRVDINVGFSANWDTAPLYLTYLGGELGEIGSSVPELSTWAMLLIGFAGLGFMTYRRQGTNLNMPLAPNER